MLSRDMTPFCSWSDDLRLFARHGDLVVVWSWLPTIVFFLSFLFVALVSIQIGCAFYTSCGEAVHDSGGIDEQAGETSYTAVGSINGVCRASGCGWPGLVALQCAQ